MQPAELIVDITGCDLDLITESETRTRMLGSYARHLIICLEAWIIAHSPFFSIFILNGCIIHVFFSYIYMYILGDAPK